ANGADAEQDAELGEQAITLSVYLCSFMESGRAPDLAQREHMHRLVGALLDAPGQAGCTEAFEAPPLYTLLCVSEDHELVNDLSCLLRDAGIEVAARASSHELIERPLQGRIDAMLVDAPQLAEMSRLLRCTSSEDGERR